MNPLTFSLTCLSLLGLVLTGSLLWKLPPGPAAGLTILTATAFTAVLTHMISVAHRVDRLNRYV